MIIQIRGTSGSGKTHAMREVMSKYTGWLAYHRSGRRRPLYYRRENVYVLGGYESVCGGCDTLNGVKEVYELIQSFYTTDKIVLCEGLLLSEDVKWTTQLRIEDLKVLFLTTPLDICLSRIEQRRKLKGNEKPLNPYRTTYRVSVIERARVRLLDAGVDCRRCSDDQAPGLILKWLGCTLTKEQ